ncbi:hypothetical protein LR48_Vigan01g096200 [Vigna angularis]|uniref:ABC transporter domain-containing protein n=1 Tax=Phaseolus angularis TaxID=3914 RepID=A0A0L9TLS5_PHAAN|nr:hypothetical protein LR48_Vigan01g096200 [Vigna angularis]
MVGFGGKKMRQMVVGFAGSGFDKVAIALTVSFLIHVFSAPSPALSLDNDHDDTQENGSNDAEAPPAGKVTPVTIRWRNINCCLSDKSSKNVSGGARPGRLLAIIGPSGSGKTTLLNVLAG